MAITINISLLWLLFNFVILLSYGFLNQKKGLICKNKAYYPCELM